MGCDVADIDRVVVAFFFPSFFRVSLCLMIMHAHAYIVCAWRRAAHTGAVGKWRHRQCAARLLEKNRYHTRCLVCTLVAKHTALLLSTPPRMPNHATPPRMPNHSQALDRHARQLAAKQGRRARPSRPQPTVAEQQSPLLAGVVLAAIDARDDMLLWRTQPAFVVLYDPSVALIRQLEVLKAYRPGLPLRVYMMTYEDSLQGDRLQVRGWLRRMLGVCLCRILWPRGIILRSNVLECRVARDMVHDAHMHHRQYNSFATPAIRQQLQAELDRERRTFESLIRQKEFMLVPVTAAGEQLVQGQKTVTAADVGTNARTRRAGGRASKPAPCRVVVDVREFMSSLPAVLHQQGMQLVPMQLEVRGNGTTTKQWRATPPPVATTTTTRPTTDVAFLALRPIHTHTCPKPTGGGLCAVA